METQKQKISNRAKDTNDIKITHIKNNKAWEEDEIENDRNNKMEDFLSEKNSEANNPIFIPTEGQYKPQGLMKILNKLGLLAIIFTVGGVGGVWMGQSLMPKLAIKDPFKNYAFFKSVNDHTTIINRTEEIKISEDSALMESIRKASTSVVKITANYMFQEKLSAAKKKTATPKISIENRNLNGVVITSDGLILTRDPQNFNIDLAKNEFTEVNYTISHNGKEFTVSGLENITFFDAVDKTVGGTEKGNMVILKIKAENLPVASLGDSMNIEYGERVVALGNVVFSGIISERSADGIITVDNKPSEKYFGSGPLADIEGKIIGVNIINEHDMATSDFIGVDQFKDFIRQVIGS